ncbi:MAG: 1-deoxy-D-xylulose-5-phosphate synthase [Puniceicoccales bacterium]|nr:1-deoxy-D-xylulose-5-phosphate synthase [Puniceicoccales bacterium]
MSILDSIRGPDDVKKIKKDQLDDLANEIRGTLISVIGRNGGHLASNLGVVELTIALHRVFDSPKDKIIFDVSHQTYVHKLLTGRNGPKFSQIRLSGGYSGFSAPEESESDAFVAGHAGTALSVALGFAHVRDKAGIGDRNNHIIAVLGDASMSCGMTLEALNNLPATAKRLIVIVNDNEFSIGSNVGAIPLYLNKILRSKFYGSITASIKKILGSGKVGKSIIRNVRTLQRAIKSVFLPTSYFEYYGLRYFGPIDGHNIAQLEEILEFCKRCDRPILVHVKTIKGRGCVDAVSSPERFHGVEPAANIDGTQRQCEKKIVSYGEILGMELTKLARKDKRIIGVVAAMAYGTGLFHMRENLPGQYVDVGIAEEYAVTFCAALAKAGMRPVCAIYSTFLQRAFDQVIHDVCLQNLPIIFCLDRAGVSPRDGATHHGMFDISYLRLIPNSIILQPRSGQEFVDALHSAFAWQRPVFIRYQRFCRVERDTSSIEFSKFLELGSGEELVAGKKICLLALGNMVEVAEEVAKHLRIAGVDPGIVSAIFAKPIDGGMLEKLGKNYEIIATLEDNVLAGGFGSAVLEFYDSIPVRPRVLRFGWPDKFVRHGSSVDILRSENGLSAGEIADKITGMFFVKT